MRTVQSDNSEPNTPLTWRKSSRCASSGCIEIARQGSGVAIRDSKLGDTSPVLHFTDQEFAVFLEGAALGEFHDLTSRS